MAKRKIIEDSDNEDNAEASPSPEKAARGPELSADAPVDDEISAAPEEPQPSIGQSTGSTGTFSPFDFPVELRH